MSWPVIIPAKDPGPPTKKLRMSTSDERDGVGARSSKVVSKSMSRLLSITAPISPPISPEQKLQDGPVTVTSAHRDCEDLVLYPGNATTDRVEGNLFPSSRKESLKSSQGKNNSSYSRIQPYPKASDMQMPRKNIFRGSDHVSFRPRVNHLYNRNSTELLKFLREEAKPETFKQAKVRRVPVVGELKTAALRDRKHSTHTNHRPVSSRSLGGSQALNFPIMPRPVGKLSGPKRVRPVDDDFRSVPDYSPPVSALTNPDALCAKWTAGAIDLSSDPNYDLLDAREIRLASVLRLTCAQYLTGKRRIFQGKVLSLRKDKMFRKTDAQQVCKIDVNKASMLWKAFDEGGWFKRSLFEPYLIEVS